VSKVRALFSDEPTKKLIQETKALIRLQQFLWHEVRAKKEKKTYPLKT
jgi:hypothetical protein